MTLCLLMPFATFADPIVLNPGSVISLYVVIGTALIVEAGIVSAILTFRGVAPLNLFIGYLITNISVYLLVFGLPFFDESAQTIWKEIAVVLLDGLAIKILTGFSIFQGDDYRKIAWWLALLVSITGNAVSYLIGEIASHQHL